MTKTDYSEFNHPKLANVYDSFNALTDDKHFWLNTIKGLGVKNIVDLGCGTGLLTSELAGLGHHTVGIDPSQAMLEVAKQKENAKKIEWRLGSAEQLTKEETDLVIMTSHVAQFFLDDKEWIAALRRINVALTGGGYVLFDSKNPMNAPWERWSKKEAYKMRSTPEGDVEFWIESPIIDGKYVEHELHYLFLKDQEKLVSRNKLVYRSKEELLENLQNSGFEVEKIYGDWDGSHFEENSEEMIFLAKKVHAPL
jgi:ubiquinone/menaquinone biosynthesis C-methylase UbiE